MIAREAPRGAMPAPPLPAMPLLVHWLVLIGGLALLTALRIDEIERTAPLWLGSVLGTGAGQILAQRRMRMWLFAFIVGNLTWIAPLTVMPLWPLFGPDIGGALETFVVALIPAAFCGYLSLSERGALAAFWFPAVPWVVAILDRSSGLSLEGEESWLLLGALAVLLLGLLRARETRRVALWRGYAATRLAAPGGEAVLRQAPLRWAGQLGWMTAVGLATLALTGWIAPSLWQQDDLEGERGQAIKAKMAPGTPDGKQAWTCCPEASSAKAERKKVKEYLPIRRAHDGNAREEPRSAGCVTCVDGLPVAPAKGPVSGPGPADPSPHQAQTSIPGSAAPPAPSPPKPAAAPPAPPVPSSGDKAPSGELPRARAAARAARGPRAGVVVPPVMGVDPLAWILALAVSATVVQLVSRPVRRLVVLRHLQKPLWPETVDQRVSNLWQLMLVGLRDAGWQTTPGEQPHELARRVGLEGVEACATVLERARHGVRVDGADLEEMERSAHAVYRAARGGIGLLARAASWLRWPLT